MHPERQFAASGPVEPAATARDRLRQATAAEHAQVDALYSGFDLSTASGYAAFLAAHHACLAPIEDALTAAGAGALVDDWPERRRAHLLADDLRGLDAPVPGHRAPPALSGPAALLGAIYVLEGSRFGGAFIARSLPAGAPARFLRAPSRPGAWRDLLAALERGLTREIDMAHAALAARAVFAAFQSAGRASLEGALVR